MIDDWEDRARRAEDEAATLRGEIEDLRAQLAAARVAGYRDAVEHLRGRVGSVCSAIAADHLEEHAGGTP